MCIVPIALKYLRNSVLVILLSFMIIRTLYLKYFSAECTVCLRMSFFQLYRKANSYMSQFPKYELHVVIKTLICCYMYTCMRLYKCNKYVDILYKKLNN